MAVRTTPFIAAGTWTVDPAHSSVEFSVKHMGIANVRGKFNEFEGTLEVGEDLAHSRAHGTVKVASIDTNEEKRDAHLRSPDFFNVEEHPEITYETTRIEPRDEESSCVYGNLTMHGVTKPITTSMTVTPTPSSFAASGVFRAKATDFGFDPYSAPFGVLKNRDEMKFVVVYGLPQKKAGVSSI